MSRNAVERTENTLADWALIIPLAVVGAFGAVGFGAVLMVKWAASIAVKGWGDVRLK